MSGVPEPIDEQSGGRSFPAVLFALHGTLCKPRLTSMRGLRPGWMELRGSSLIATVNFGLGLEPVETQSPQNNVLEKQNTPIPGLSSMF